ncbi:hypothetical protein DFP73DRAFT_360099 [Morchella snyderi]|nr:hypothetical protein DFP73DRAFT_360099 [Morchella snyderi]
MHTTMPETSSTQPIPIPTPIITTPVTYKLTLQFSPWSLSFPRLFLSALASPPITRGPYLVSPGSSESDDTIRPSKHSPETLKDFGTVRASQRDDYDPFLDRTDTYSDSGSSGYAESCHSYASYADKSDEMPSLLYARNRYDVTPPSPCGEYDNLLDFETPLPVPRVFANPSVSKNGENEDKTPKYMYKTPVSDLLGHIRALPQIYRTPTPPRQSDENIYSPLQEYHLELPSLSCLWEWRWTVISITTFLVGWCVLAVIERDWDGHYIVPGTAFVALVLRRVGGCGRGGV